MSDCIDILSALVGFDTVSSNSNLGLLAWIEDYLGVRGVSSRRIYDDSGQKANLFATIGPATVPGYILSGHTDVVPVEGQDWHSDPFRLTEQGGRLYGRGACDMKGFLAVCLSRVDKMRAAPLKIPLHLCFSYDEEVGCLGVHSLIASLKDEPAYPLGCFVGEPTGMQIVTAHKTKHNVYVTVRGRSCHSALAPHGVNAVEYAALLIARIREIGLRLKAGVRDPLFDVPFSTSHTGTIAGGTTLNIVPDACRFSFEFRVLPKEDSESLVAGVVAYAREMLEPEMKAIDAGAGFEFEFAPAFPGLDTAPDAAITTLARRLAARNDHAKVAYGTEAGLFDQAGIATVIIGPGAIERAHKPDEFIEIAELEACGRFIDRLIDTVRA